MIDAPEILDTKAHAIASIHLTIPRAQIREAMGPALRELHAALASQGLAPTAPWFTHHRRMDPAIFDYEVCLAVGAHGVASGRVTFGEVPAMRVARAVLRGGYEQLGAAWGELDAWIASHGHAPAADLYEHYVVGPDASHAPADWRTALVRPIVARA